MGDRRVRRTDQALILALIELVIEKHWDAITVQDLLDSADVGRSTFYAHYRGKDDLLYKSFERLLEHLDRTMEQGRGELAHSRIAPVRELFGHVRELRGFHQALARAGMLDRQYHAGIEVLSGTMARRLAARGETDGSLPLQVRSRALAGALFALLRWWVDQDAAYTPERMDQLFHALAVTP